MEKEILAIIGFGAIGLFALAMLVIERRGVAARKAARGGREVDLSGIFDATREDGQPTDR